MNGVLKTWIKFSSYSCLRFNWLSTGRSLRDSSDNGELDFY